MCGHIGHCWHFLRRLNGANPFDYLSALLRHAEERKQNPPAWVPQNYRDTVARLVARSRVIYYESCLAK